jgi:hypothetical protein
MTTTTHGGRRDNRKRRPDDARGGKREPAGGRPRQVKLFVETVFMTCPYCNEVIPDPVHFSEYITKDEYTDLPKQLTCTACGQVSHKPKWP